MFPNFRKILSIKFLLFSSNESFKTSVLFFLFRKHPIAMHWKFILESTGVFFPVFRDFQNFPIKSSETQCRLNLVFYFG
jgi:hypothetical protein